MSPNVRLVASGVLPIQSNRSLMERSSTFIGSLQWLQWWPRDRRQHPKRRPPGGGLRCPKVDHRPGLSLDTTKKYKKYQMVSLLMSCSLPDWNVSTGILSFCAMAWWYYWKSWPTWPHSPASWQSCQLANHLFPAAGWSPSLQRYLQVAFGVQSLHQSLGP